MGKVGLAWCFLIATWSANIIDLIRGTWFYPTTESIIFWNFIGLMAFISIILNKKLPEDCEESSELSRGAKK